MPVVEFLKLHFLWGGVVGHFYILPAPAPATIYLPVPNSPCLTPGAFPCLGLPPQGGGTCQAPTTTCPWVGTCRRLRLLPAVSSPYYSGGGWVFWKEHLHCKRACMHACLPAAGGGWRQELFLGVLPVFLPPRQEHAAHATPPQNLTCCCISNMQT